MITFNTYYRSCEELTQFVEANAIHNSNKVLVQVFTAYTDRQKIESLIKEIKNILPDCVIVGATTDGEIMDGLVSIDHTVLSFTVFEQITPKSCLTTHLKSSFATGAKLAKALIQGDTKVLISFTDGLHTNGEEYLKGINSNYPDIVVSGGLAGDHANFAYTYVFNEQEITSNGAVAVALNGPKLNVHTRYSFNWQPIGKEMTITKVEHNRVYTIDNKTANETYAHYLGKDIAAKLPKTAIEFPMIINRDGIHIARAVLNKRDDGSLVFAGDLHQGDRVRFGYGNAKMILETSKNELIYLNEKPIESIFIYSCMARRRFMPHLIDQEIKPLLALAPVSGFFTYGEFYTDKHKALLNQTMTILALSESDEGKYAMLNDQKTGLEESEEMETIRAFTHLVNTTSKELDTLNGSLQAKVNEEVEKNRKKDQQILQQSRLAQMGEMISMIAHQWRQPLSAISATSADLGIKIMLNKYEKETFQEKLKNISGYSQHLSKTIDDFRDFYKSNKEKRAITFEEVFNSALNIIEISIKNKNIELKKEFTCLETIHTYPNELKQVVLNLIKNAEDALLEKGTSSPMIMLKTAKDENYVYLEVSDNAGGIPEAIINRIFEPYYTTKEKRDGTGLGLYMSKMIIEDHCDGTLKTENSDNGAVFTIRLPLDSRERT